MTDRIDILRNTVKNRLGDYRAEHVLSTEREAMRIATVYLPEKMEKVRISALLHDITKEYDVKKQLQILSDFDIIVDNTTLHSPTVLHAMTAALVIPSEFTEFADEEVINAVKNHTVGSEDMTLLDIVIYLADYIEPLRRFEDCKKLREFFWNGIEEYCSREELLLHLYSTMVMSFDLTIKNLICEKKVIVPKTFSARNEFVLKCDSISEELKNERKQ